MFLVDTGTNLALLVPNKAYRRLVMQLLPPDSYRNMCAYFETGVTCVCSQILRAMPRMWISLGGRDFELPRSVLFRQFRAQNCQLQIQPNFDKTQEWVLGAAFLEACVIVFDFSR